MTTASKKFILIDDSKIDLFVVEKLIQQNMPGSSIKSFDQPNLALEYFQTFVPEENYIVLLDIQMPVINGFQFLDEFALLPDDIKAYYSIFILTSSNNPTDINRGRANKYVADVLIKPLNKDTLLNLLRTNF